MSYLEELLPEFRKGAKIRRADWGERCYIRRVEGRIVTAKGNPYNPTWQDLDSGLWEFYKDPESDWQYIIDHKFLCWFWDNDESNKSAGFLAVIEENEYLPFLSYGGEYFKHCRPVRRDEVTFYEAKKDE
jgi:hypothetical protein|nr:MAG TPA: Protein of unknown function (DUF2829) [Caudoviricetes sp.]